MDRAPPCKARIASGNYVTMSRKKVIKNLDDIYRLRDFLFDKVSTLPNKVSISPNKVSTLPNKVSISPNKVSISPNKVSISPNKMTLNIHHLSEEGMGWAFSCINIYSFHYMCACVICGPCATFVCVCVWCVYVCVWVCGFFSFSITAHNFNPSAAVCPEQRQCPLHISGAGISENTY